MSAEKAKSKQKIVVVVVDDDRYVLDFLKFTLEQQGFEVFAADDGEKGLGFVQAYLPVLVVLDLMLPKMDGFTILKRLAEQPETAKIPVIVVSAYAASESTRRMVQSQKNVREVFTKPLRTKEFIEKIQALVNKNAG